MHRKPPNLANCTEQVAALLTAAVFGRLENLERSRGVVRARAVIAADDCACTLTGGWNAAAAYLARAGARGCCNGDCYWMAWAHVEGTSSFDAGSCPTTKSKACSTTPLAAVSSGRTRFITSGVRSLLVVLLS